MNMRVGKSWSGSAKVAPPNLARWGGNSYLIPGKTDENDNAKFMSWEERLYLSRNESLTDDYASG